MQRYNWTPDCRRILLINANGLDMVKMRWELS